MSKPEDKPFRIRGLVVDSKTRRGIAGLRVEAWDKDLLIDDLVGSAVTDAQGAFQIDFDESYFSELFFDRRPDLFFKIYQDGRLLASTEDSVLWNVECGETEITIEIESCEPGEHPAEHRSVEGQVFFDNGAPAAALTLRFYNRGFAGAETRLGEVKTDDRGFYKLSYDAGGKQVNLEARMLDAGGQELSLSAVKYNAGTREVLNLVAPMKSAALAPEYERLTADLLKQVGDLNKLADARENAERQDLTLLHQATGWDARLIAFAVLAFRLNRETGLQPEVLYALFRTGLPTVKEQLSLVNAGTVVAALYKATSARLVNLSAEQITQAKEKFEDFASRTRSEVKAPGALSSFGDLLAQSGLTGDDKDLFYDLYFAHQSSGAELWQAARDQGLSEATIDDLRVQGKLAYLTLNNAGLTGLLKQAIDSPENLSQLVQMDLHKADEWKARLNSLASNQQALGNLIPPAYTGETSERLDAYANDLARKVRVSFPTQVVARMIQNDELSLGDSHKKDDVHAFLGRATGLGFELGRTPVDKFVLENRHALFQTNAPEEQVNAATEGVKKLQRLYQITPSNESLKALLDHGFSSAHAVTALTRDDFVNRVGDSLPSRAEAELVYRKAQQVSAVAHNVLIAAKQLDRTPVVYALSTSAERREAAIDNLITQYPKMEALFGSLDFCECEECRSVLSPAAYFVDLLQFLDRDETTWESFLVDWGNKHNRAPYPFKDQFEWEGFKADWKKVHNNEEFPDTKNTPYDVLVERRPDLPHLSLTCENTQTALPYIDLVNEILEYYVANDKLDATAAHDTGTTTTEELLAEPQNILPEAYTVLKAERYPLSLPFDLWLETVRIFCSHFETPFWQVLEIFRPSDDLYAPSQNPKPYYRADIFTEYLGISPTEFALFTENDPLAKWHLLYGFDDSQKTDNQNQQDALGTLKSAKNLAHTLGVSYTELVDIIGTHFVNPALDQMVILKKLGLEFSDITRYFTEKGKSGYADEQNAIEERFKALDDAYQLADGQTLATLEGLQRGAFKQTLLLMDTSKSCDFDQTFLQFGDGQTAGAMVFLKINLFVRLWRKLGWTIEETDRALQVFLPKNSDLTDASKLVGAMKTALLYLAHLKALEERLKVGRDGRQRPLSLWSNLATTGQNPLYAQLFLTQSPKTDAVFDQPFGQYLRYWDSGTKQYESFRYDDAKQEDVKTGNVALKNHLPAVQGALSLSVNEIELILSDAGKKLSEAELSLDNVSLLYRYGLLAQALRLSVRDLIVLKDLSGLDPFEALESDPITDIEKDYPFSQTLRFIEVADSVKDSGLTIEDLDYLLRHRFDPVGKYRPNADALLAQVKSLASSVQKIVEDNPVPIKPAHTSLTDDVLRQRLALVLPPDVAETFFAMWTGTVEHQEIQENVQPNQKLDPARFAAEPAIHVSYDEVKMTQRLIYRGVMVESERQRLATKYTDLSALFQNIHDQATNFFAEHLQKDQDHPFGFLQASDFETLFAAPPTAALTDTDRKANELQMLEKRDALVVAFLPFLQHRLIRQLLAEALAISLNADPSLTEALMNDANLLSDPSEPNNPPPLVDAFAAVKEPGLSLSFFSTPDGAGSVLETRTVTLADTKLDPNNSKRGQAKSARFDGYLEVPATGAYRFFALLDKKDVEMDFRLDARPDPVIRHLASKDNDEESQFVELKSGLLYRFTLDANNLDKGDLRLLVQGENLPKGDLDRLILYPLAAVERFRRAQLLLAKTLQLLQGFPLSEREVRYLLTHAADFDNLDLSKLPTREASLEIEAIAREYQEKDSNLKKEHAILRARNDYPDLAREADDAAATGTALLEQLLRLADYTRLRRDLAAGGDGLVSIFETKLPGDAYRIVAALMRRDEKTVEATATQLQLLQASDFANERGLGRLWAALKLVEKLGVAVEVIARSTRMISNQETQENRFTLAQELRNTVRSRYESEHWQRVAQSIFDRLRQRRRDALAACIMHRRGFERSEQLFEYFLIDSGMEPVVQTSRLRFAISSVQTFIQRCFLNLEAEVDPSALKSSHWQWMKRYRVWEANRKIFLFPENWLEPEFRDDKTHLFQELEGALLQGDVSNDLAEDAFFNYLNKLEEIAQLEMVTMYVEEKPDAESNIIHLIGRTHNLPHKYFYRRYDHHMWTPWEPVNAEIEGDHVVAMVWRERLHLFWVTFMEKGKLENSQGSKTIKQVADTYVSDSLQKQIEIQLNWCEYFQGHWMTRTSSGFANPIRAIPLDPVFESQRVFVHASKEYQADGREGALNIHINGPFHPDAYTEFYDEDGNVIDGDFVYRTAFRLVSKNSQPEVEECQFPTSGLYSTTTNEPTQAKGSGALTVTFTQESKTIDGKLSDLKRTPQPILQRGGEFFLLRPSNPMEFGRDEIRNLRSPFFYQDNQHTFFVEATVSEKTAKESEDFGITNSTSGATSGDLERISNQAQLPLIGSPPPPDALGNFTVQPNTDWLTRATTTVTLDGHSIGQRGSVGVQVGLGLLGGLNLIDEGINSRSLKELNGNPGAPSTIG